MKGNSRCYITITNVCPLCLKNHIHRRALQIDIIFLKQPHTVSMTQCPTNVKWLQDTPHSHLGFFLWTIIVFFLSTYQLPQASIFLVIPNSVKI